MNSPEDPNRKNSNTHSVLIKTNQTDRCTIGDRFSKVCGFLQKSVCHREGQCVSKFTRIPGVNVSNKDMSATPNPLCTEHYFLSSSQTKKEEISLWSILMSAVEMDYTFSFFSFVFLTWHLRMFYFRQIEITKKKKINWSNDSFWVSEKMSSFGWK